MKKIIKNKVVLFVGFFLLVIASCKKTQDSTGLVNKWNQKIIILPNDSLVRNIKDNSRIKPLTKKVKVLVPINADCNVCVDELKKWMSFMKPFVDKVGFIFLINSSDNLNNFRIMDSLEVHFNYPYFQDDYKKLFKLNAFPEEKLHQAVLLDESNKVILIGNPILSKKIEDLYINEIRKRIE